MDIYLIASSRPFSHGQISYHVIFSRRKPLCFQNGCVCTYELRCESIFVFVRRKTTYFCRKKENTTRNHNKDAQVLFKLKKYRVIS